MLVARGKEGLPTSRLSISIINIPHIDLIITIVVVVLQIKVDRKLRTVVTPYYGLSGHQQGPYGSII